MSRLCPVQKKHKGLSGLRLARRTVSTEGGKVRRKGGSDQATDVWDQEVSPGAQTGFTHYTGLRGSLDSPRLDQLHKKSGGTDQRLNCLPSISRLPHLVSAVAPAALSHRPIGDAAMVSAISQAGDGIAAAEDEVAAAGIADWPVAVLLGQLQ